MRKIYLVSLSLVLTVFSFLSAQETSLRVLEGMGTRLFDINDSGNALHAGGYYDYASNTSTSMEPEAYATNRLNNAGDVAGKMPFLANDGSNLDQAAFRKNGIWNAIGYFPGDVPGNSWFGGANSISENSKFVTGQISVGVTGSYPFIYDTETNTLTKLTDGDDLWLYGRGQGVNDAGYVSGFVDREDIFNTGTFWVPAYFDPSGNLHYIDFDTPEYGEAADINNAGQIVGYKGNKAFFYDITTGEYLSFGATEDYSDPKFTSISENGIAIGYAGGLGGRDVIIYHQGLAKPILLKDYLISQGVNITTFDGTLGTGMGISPDGHFICGFDNAAPVFFAAGWVVYLEGVPTEPGCLDAPFGQWPTGAAFIPACSGEPETITTAAWTGEYSLVQVTAGKQYIFSSSIPTDYITIGNEDGTEVLAYGTTSVTWIAPSDQVIRFYLHLDEECNSINSGLRLRIVQCQDAPGCEWTVHVYDALGFGDEVSWQLRNNEGTVLLSGGNYGAGYDDTQTTIAEGPLEFYIESMGFFGDNTPSYTVSNGTEEVASGSLSPAMQEATHSDLNCDEEEEPEDGCFVTGQFDQWPSTTFVPACSGIVEVITTAGWAGEFSKVQVTAGTEYIFSSSVTTDFITIADEDEEIAFATGTGSVTWTSPIDQVIRFYTHLNEDCEIEEVSRTRAVQCGDIPPPPANDDCADAIALGCGDSANGTTLGANNSGGNLAGDVFYSFTGSGSEELVTVSLCGSSYDTYLRVFTDCTLSTEIAFNDDATTGDCAGTLQSELTFTSDGTSTYYIMVEGFSSNVGDFVIDISCAVPPPPPADCEDHEVLDNGMENAYFFTNSLAVDILVGDDPLTVEGAYITVAVPMGSNANSFSFIFYDNNSGVPGTQVDDAAGNIIGSEVIGQNFDHDFIRYNVDFEATVNLNANTTYWMQVQSDAVAWDWTSAMTSIIGQTGMINDGSGWATADGGEFVYALYCEEMGTGDLNSFDFAYYPNPVKDILNIESEKAVESIDAFNLAGQKVISNIKLTQGKVNLSSLTPGTYVFRVTLQGGQLETFKIIKK